MITNVGGMGIDLAWAPLCSYTKVPLLMTIGAQRDRVVAVDGQPQVRPIVQVGVTFDHRFMDGVHAAEMNRELKKYFAEPEKYFS
jgi:pyruvate dehydrogenase E2 component (dihydrolipoamide acetyltransferase)